MKLHFAKFKFAKLVADDIESNPGPDNSKSTLQYDTWYIQPECLEVDIQVESISVNPKKSSTTGKSIIICSNNIPPRKFNAW